MKLIEHIKWALRVLLVVAMLIIFTEYTEFLFRVIG